MTFKISYINVIKFTLYAGKHSKSSKIKNPKKAAETPTAEKPGWRIPRVNPILEPDSDDDMLGQEPLPSEVYAAKFSATYNSTVHSMLNPDVLLAPKFHALCDDFSKLVLYSASKQTWAKHCSAWKLYEEFCKDFGEKFSLPLESEQVRAFATWATTNKHLKSTTVKSYISSLNVANILVNAKTQNLSSDPCTKMVIKGARNYIDPLLTPKANRLPMDINLLVVLGHKISMLNWNEYAKQVLWTACTTSFFSSCRMGEILSTCEKNFDPETSLLWGNIEFLPNKEILIFIPYTKTTGFKGKFIDLYPIQSSNLCPALALIRLRKMAVSAGIWNSDSPVFRFKSGKLLTKAKLNLWLGKLLSEFTDSNHIITGHSFRAAIPSLLAAHPDKDTAKLIQEWGGWTSNSFFLYTNNKKKERKLLFEKIVDTILNV